MSVCIDSIKFGASMSSLMFYSPPIPYDSESIIIGEMNCLLRDLLRVIDGQKKFISFEPCYRRCYNLIVHHKRGNELDAKLVWVWRALSTVPSNKAPSLVQMVEDVLMLYDKKWRIAKNRPSVAQLATMSRVERVSRAKQTIERFVPIIVENFYKPGGLFERSCAAEWDSKAWCNDHANKKRKL